jgi:hypothetical protein
MPIEGSQTKNKVGFWGKVLGRYLAWPMMVFATMAIGALFFEAAAVVIGDPAVSLFPSVMAGLGASVMAFGYFCQDGHSLQKKMEKWGVPLDDKTKGWQWVLKHNIANFVTLVMVIAAAIISWLCPPAFLVNFAASFGLHPVGVAVLAGSAVWIASLVCRIPYAIATFFLDKKKDENDGKKVLLLPLRIIDKLLGVVLAIIGAVFATVATNGPLLELFGGAGVAANLLSLVVAGFAGLAYFSQDGQSMMQRLHEWVQSCAMAGGFRQWCAKHKASIMGGLTIAAVGIATLVTVVFCQPPFVQTVLIALHLETLSKVGLTAVIGMVFGSVSILGSLIKQCCTEKKAQEDYLVHDDEKEEFVKLSPHISLKDRSCVQHYSVAVPLHRPRSNSDASFFLPAEVEKHDTHATRTIFNLHYSVGVY